MQLDTDTLRKLVGELPAMPQAVQDVLTALRNDDVRTDDCADRIAHDQALTAKTLKLANSAFYGVPARVATINDAIQVLGLRTLSTLLEAAALVNLFRTCECPDFQPATFWRHSIGTAIASRTLAAELGLDPNVAFTTGLLHDIGRLALATHFPEQFAQALALQKDAGMTSIEAERHALRTDHAQVGATVATVWHYPGTIINAIAMHHESPTPGPAGTQATIAQVVQAANEVAHLQHQPPNAACALPAAIAPAWACLGLDQQQYKMVHLQTATGVETLCQALGA
jgi:putative nucleotidyltransferase with HDIG domain